MMGSPKTGAEASVLVKALPSAITIMALWSALIAVRYGLKGELHNAFWALMASAVFDGLDGHVARAFEVSSAFGAELDSLCDLVDFGVCPSLVLYQWCSTEGPRLARDVGLPEEATPWHSGENAVWIACLVYTCCCALRLARFNLSNESPVPRPPHSVHFVKSIGDNSQTCLVQGECTPAGRQRKGSQRSEMCRRVGDRVECKRTEGENNEDWRAAQDSTDSKWLDAYINRQKFFEGVPAPMGAFLAMVPLVFWFQYGYPYEEQVRLESVVAANLVLVGILMISRIRTFSSKMLIRGPVHPNNPRTSHLRSRTIGSLIAKVVAAAAAPYAFFTEPWRSVLCVAAVYVASLPLGQAVYSILLTDTYASH